MKLRGILLTAAALACCVAAQPSSPDGSVPTATATTTNATEQTLGSECGPRIRKPWDRLTPVEKELYLRALERAMDDGLYIKFVEIHTEQMTTAEAHRTCMFLYWHRALLLGFENMLRAYGGEFACLTVPYWDYVAHNAQFLAGTCGSMEDCSPILRELGGSTSGRAGSVDVNGTPIRGRCVANRPVNHFCEAAGLSGRGCAQCVPRGDWSSARFPGTTSVSSLMRQLFASPTIDSVATNLEQGIHNTIHSALGGAMGVLEAPADPIFWSHHAAIDLLHSLFYHCAVGNTSPMALEAKLADPRQYVACARREVLPTRARDRSVLLPQSSVTLRSGGALEAADSVLDPQNPLARFFAPLPTEYMGYSDVRDLGEFSYNYEMSGLLADMYTTCADVTALLGGPTGPVGPLAGVGAGVGGFGAAPAGGAFGGFRRLEDPATSSFLEAVLVSRNGSHHEAANGGGNAPSDEGAWYREALRVALNATMAMAEAGQTDSTTVASLATALALREVEKMTCMFYDECRGNVTDFSAAFRRSFHTNASTPCFTVVQNVNSGRDAMLVANWKDVMLQFLSC